MLLWIYCNRLERSFGTDHWSFLGWSLAARLTGSVVGQRTRWSQCLHTFSVTTTSSARMKPRDNSSRWWELFMMASLKTASPTSKGYLFFSCLFSLFICLQQWHESLCHRLLVVYRALVTAGGEEHRNGPLQYSWPYVPHFWCTDLVHRCFWSSELKLFPRLRHWRAERQVLCVFVFQILVFLVHLNTSLRHSQPTSFTVRYLTSPDRTSLSAQHFRSSGLLCCRFDSLELATGQSPWSGTQQQQLQTIVEDESVSSIPLSTHSAVEMLHDSVLYKNIIDIDIDIWDATKMDILTPYLISSGRFLSGSIWYEHSLDERVSCV